MAYKKVLFLFSLYFLVLDLCACKVPVFRYALERWEPDKFKILICEKDYNLLNKEEKKLFNYVFSNEGENVKIYLPNIPIPFFDEGVVGLQNAFNSPLRTKIYKDLISGTSAYWVFLKSGKQNLDSGIEEIVKKSLASAELFYQNKLNEELKKNDLKDDLLTKVPLSIKFKYTTLDRDSIEEKHFINMLLTLEPDLKEIDQPMLFAIYGRGRCLPPLVGKGINEFNILNEDCGFLCGECSCEIKAQNPGVDLLFNFNWEDALKGLHLVSEKILPPVSGFPIVSSSSNEDHLPGMEKIPDHEPLKNSFISPLLFAEIIFILLILSALIFWSKKA